MHLCDLNSEQGDAAGAFDQHHLAGPHVPTFDEREPRGEPGNRQRAGLYRRQGPWCPNNPILRQHYIFGEHSGVETAERPV
ncbi:hypothetical protein PUR22_03655 [Mycolicibacterium porcinum]|uniref:hypothetical protein n=1 Tax=Mycolicibacterium porcinum TaxID=39693 RepID=UPI0031F7BD38